MKTTEIASFLSEFPLFNTLKESEIARLSEQAEVLKRPKFNFIYHFDDPSDKFFILAKGIVKTGLHSDDGREIIKTVLHKGSMFGELGIVGEQKRAEFARAMNEDVVCIVISIKDLRYIMAQNMNLGFGILDKVGERLRKSEAKLEALIFKDARERIIDFIRSTAASRGRRVGFEMMFKHCLTQQDIANLTGTSRQTVTSVLNELRKENKIYFNRRSILIRDMEGLA
jgi:CRP/FNR family cyclic AMP-dependent transcriptional regulator